MAGANEMVESNQLKKVQLGHSDLHVSVACLGTMLMGEGCTKEDAFSQLDYFYERGGNFLDTSEIYSVPTSEKNAGLSESIVGEWMELRGVRDNIIIGTKVSGPSDNNRTTANRSVPPVPDAPRPRLDRANILAAVDGSLRRLRTNRIDLYQLHWPDRYVPGFGFHQFNPEMVRDAVPFTETVEAVGELIRTGKVKHWGLSNETAYGMTQICETARQLGVPLPITIQNDYSLCERHFDLDVAEACHAYGLRLIPYGVLCGGFLSGKYLDNPQAEGRLTKHPTFQARYRSDATRAAALKYRELARAKGISLMTLAIAWVARRWHVNAVITGQTSVAQMHEYLDAVGAELDEETLEAVERIHREARCPNWSD